MSGDGRLLTLEEIPAGNTGLRVSVFIKAAEGALKTDFRQSADIPFQD